MKSDEQQRDFLIPAEPIHDDNRFIGFSYGAGVRIMRTAQKLRVQYPTTLVMILREQEILLVFVGALLG